MRQPRVDASVSGGERETPAADDVQASRALGAALSLRLVEASVSRSPGRHAGLRARRASGGRRSICLLAPREGERVQVSIQHMLVQATACTVRSTWRLLSQGPVRRAKRPTGLPCGPAAKPVASGRPTSGDGPLGSHAPDMEPHGRVVRCVAPLCRRERIAGRGQTPGCRCAGGVAWALGAYAFRDPGST